MQVNVEQFVELIVKRLGQTKEACRLFHGRGGCYKGLEDLNIDYYPPYLHWRCYQKMEIVEYLIQHLQRVGVDQSRHIIQHRFERPIRQFCLQSSLPEKVRCQELSVNYDVNFNNQNSGIFLDMQAGRQWLADYVAQFDDCKVLNLFAYTCAFSLIACQAGAELVVNVDMSAGVLKQGQRNHQLNHYNNSVKFLKYNVMKSFAKLAKISEYHVVVVDPPTFQRGSFDAKRHYQKLARKLAEFRSRDFLFCLNDPRVSVREFKQWIEQPELSYRYIQRVENPRWVEEKDEDYALKVLHYKKD